MKSTESFLRKIPLLRLAAVLFITLPPAAAHAQTPRANPLSDYVGTYEFTPGHTVEIVAGSELFAVIDGARYKLRPSGVDEFINATAEKIPFRRGANGKVTGYEDDGKFHARISPRVTPEAAALMRPRPRGQDSPKDYHYRAPRDLHDGIAVGDIAQSDIGEATATAIVRDILDGTYADVHSVLLFQHGKLVMEEYFYGYSAARTHQLRSATKSVVSALTGIAIDRGALRGVDERVLPRMSYGSYANPDPRKSAMTLGNFLSMSSGLACNDHSSDSPGRETIIDATPDWVKATLDLPMINDPGSKAFYCSGGVAVVGRMTENAVHMALPDYAQANLFGKMGIPRSDWSWNYNLTNADQEYSQIHLRPRDMLKMGMLYADGGRWQGRQIVSASWVKESLARQSSVDDTDYGYFWWRPYLNVKTPRGVERVRMNAAQGNGGQKIYIVPQYDFIGVFTGGDYNASEAPPNKIMIHLILPALIAAYAKRAN